ncbi:MAG: hypothetical protein HXY49_03705 [Ignavibacteriaceae bacterium]|nr:hypothetical protein [Ignavibacteriaceae bacterium]
MKKIFTLAILTFIITSTITSDIFAIPAFARKYNMTCKTCHSPFPKLKSYGEEFAGNGFVLKDQDAPRYFVDTGDETLSLIRDLPIALRLEGFVTYNKTKSKQFDFFGPSALKLLSGGNLGGDISYYIYYILEEGDIGKIEDAFIMFNDLFGSGLDIAIGQFQVSDPLFKRELRLTREDYLIYKLKPGYSNINLTYDRGVVLSYGFPTGTDLSFEVVNGSGIGSIFSNDNFDNDKYKNFFGRISQDVIEELRIGAFGYFGKEEIENTILSTKCVNEIKMYGADATIVFDPLELNLQFLERRDNDPFALGPANPEIKSRGGFAELIFTPMGDDSKWYSVAIFNYIDSNIDLYDFKSGSLHIGYLARRNIRLVAEYGYDFKDKFGQISFGFIAAY